MDYIQSSELINEVENSLSVYFNTGKADKSTLPSVIRSCLAKMGNLVLPNKEAVLEITNYKCKLPEGFYKITCAICCQRKHTVIPDINPHTETRRVCELNMCERACDVCRDDCGNMFKIIQRIEDRIIHWDQIDYMTASNSSRNHCEADCFKFRSKNNNEFEIKSGYFHTNFEHGMVHITYKENLETEEGFSVPDYPEITDWIKQAMIYQVFLDLYRKGEDVRQKLDYEKNELRILYLNALAFYRTSSVQNYKKLSTQLAKEFVMLENSIYAVRPKRFSF